MSKNNKRLILIFAVLIVALIIINRLNDPREKRITYFKLNPEQIHTILMTTPNDTLRIVRTDTEWLIEQPFVFPAERSRMETFMEQIIPVETSSTPVSITKDSHREYLVSEERGTLLRMYDARNNLLDAAYIGRMGRNVYARRPETEKVYQFLGHIGFQVSTNVNAWRDFNVVSFPRGQIKQLDVKYELNSYTITATDTLWYYRDAEESFPVKDTNTALRRIFTHLETLPSMRFIDDQYEDYEAILKKPQLVIAITRHNDRVTTLEFAFDEEETNFIVMKDGNRDHLYLVDANIADRFTIAHQHFMQ